MSEVRIFTSPVLDGIKIAEYKGWVTAKNVRAINLFRDFFTGFRDVVGGRSQSYQNVMGDMENEVVGEIAREAQRLGANAVVGFRIDFENIGSKGRSLLLAYAQGTAAVIV